MSLSQLKINLNFKLNKFIVFDLSLSLSISKNIGIDLKLKNQHLIVGINRSIKA